MILIFPCVCVGLGVDIVRRPFAHALSKGPLAWTRIVAAERQNKHPKLSARRSQSFNIGSGAVRDPASSRIHLVAIEHKVLSIKPTARSRKLTLRGKQST